MNKLFDELKLTGKLPSPMGVSVQILRLTQTDDYSSDDIARAVATDPALTGRVLKMANSALFASIKSVVTVQEALVRMGVRVVRNVALSFSLISSHREGTCRRFDFSKFWADALLGGVAASAIAKTLKVANPPEAYVVGLLRDVGRLAFACVHPDRYAKILDVVVAENADALAEAEAREFGIDHTELGEAMLNDWGMPPTYSASLALSRRPDAPAANEDTKKLAAALRLSGRLAEVVRASEEAVPAARAELDKVVAPFGMAKDAVDRLIAEVRMEWKGWGNALGLDGKPTAEATAAPAASVPAAEKPAARESAPEVPPSSAAATAPTAAPVPTATPTKKKIESPAARSLDILAVDDDAAALAVLVRRLESAGHRVFTAKSDKDALAVALDKNPHVVVSEWNSTAVNAVDMVRSLRLYEAGQRIYFVLLTTVNDEDKIVEAFEAGIDDHILKPARPRLLLARINAARRVVDLQEKIDADRLVMERQVAELAVLNRKFHEMSYTDTLTGLANRRSGMLFLQENWAIRNEKGIDFSVIMMDIDHFKSVNDQHGHDTGDAVLQSTAKLLEATCTDNERAFRFGGEEFVVVCPGVGVDGAVLCAERLRKRCADTIVEFKTFKRAVTISLGVAQTRPTTKSPDELLKAADEAVYRSKEGGRNRVSS